EMHRFEHRTVLGGVDVLVEDVQDQFGRGDDGYRILEPEGVEYEFVRRIVDASNAASLRLLFREQYDDEVVLVVAGVGYDDVGTRDACALENRRVATVADDRRLTVDQTLERLRFACVF